MQSKKLYFPFVLLFFGFVFHFSASGFINSPKTDCNSSQGNETTRHITGDYDNDGNKEDITITESFGSSSYFLEVTIKDKKQSHIYSQEFSSGQFLNPVYIDKKLFARYTSLFMDSVFRYPTKEKDPSLQWLLDGRSSKQVLNGENFDLVVNYNPLWSTKLEWPSGYKILAEKNDSAVLYIYTADNHYRDGKLPVDKEKIYTTIPVKGCAELTLLKTPQAVILKNKTNYSWVFINDENITEGGEKLRHPSIDTAICQGDLVFVVQKTPEKRIFMINYKTGLCLRLSERLYNREPISGIALHDDDLYVKTDAAEHRIAIDKLQKAE